MAKQAPKRRITDNRPKTVRLLATALAEVLVLAQVHARPLPEVIDDYVREGLRSNLALGAADVEVQRQELSLKSARSQWLPQAGLEARYTAAAGGRELAIPSLPVTVPFLRPREQETALILSQPLYAPALSAAVRAQRARLAASEYAHQAAARRLRRDITVGYLRWQQASGAAAIVADSRALLAENLRVNQALFAAGTSTEDQVLRAHAELLAVDQQLREADNATRQAQSTLNYLLNRPLATPLESGELPVALARTSAALAELQQSALAARPERAEVANGTRVAAALAEAARAAQRPTLAFAAAAGTQGERYEFGRGRNYSTLSLLLNWNLFDGGRRKSELDGARLRSRQLQLQAEDLDHQIELEVQQALDALQATDQWLASAEARVAAARAGFRIASRKRDEGAISQVEFIDARNALTSAELNLNLTRHELLARQAELDYATAAGTVPPPTEPAPR